MYDKKAAVEVEEGKPVRMLEVRSFQQAGEYASLKKECEANALANEEALKRKQAEEAALRKEAEAKRYKADYYAKWRFYDACKTVIVEWLAEMGDATTDLKNEAVNAMAEANKTAGASCEELLGRHPNLLPAYVKAFGEMEGE